MIRMIFIGAVLLAAPQAYGQLASTNKTSPASVAQQAKEEGLSATTKAWIAAGIFAAVVVFFVVVSVSTPTETRPLTPQEIKQAQEKFLDTVSAMNMWRALARRDDAAFREEMKLIELRRIRRLNE